MKSGFLKFTERFKGKEVDDDYFDEGQSEEYIEIDGQEAGSPKDFKSKVVVRPFIINDFGDIKETLDCLREGYTIALVNIKPLKEKDLVELKRAVNKLKKTTDAIDGDIAGFGDDWIVVTPSFATVHRGKQTDRKIDSESNSESSETKTTIDDSY